MVLWLGVRCRGRSEFCVNRIFSTLRVLKIKTLRLCVLARKHYFEQSLVVASTPLSYRSDTRLRVKFHRAETAN